MIALGVLALLPGTDVRALDHDGSSPSSALANAPASQGLSTSLAFGEELSATDLVTWYELEEMAAGQNQIVLPDCGLSGLRDDLARWIPAEGLEFSLRPPAPRRAFLYIDFVGFFDRRLEGDAREKACIPIWKETVFGGGQGGPYGYVEVFVAGRRKGIYYRGRDAGFTGPLVVPVSRDEFSDGKVNVRLRPSNRSFAVWDVFLSNAPPEQ